MPVALITGASRGLGNALARELAARGWQLVLDARDGRALHDAVEHLGAVTDVTAIPGDIADPAHRAALADAVAAHGRLDLLVNNASTLGPSPLPPLTAYAIDAFTRVLAVNTIAPLDVLQRVLPALRASGGAVVQLSSDAAVEPYPGWGGYGAAKAALDHLTAVLGVELPELRVYAFDPGDMRTAMQQAAFPDEDISDRPEPATVVPALLGLVDERPESGRYRASDLLAAASGGRR
jgi:NAD(P)-dependent dehydrogenase (short-subunit alcohol dehydrogenase family)